MVAIRHIRQYFSLLLSMGSLALLIWGLWPARMTHHTLRFTPMDLYDLMLVSQPEVGPLSLPFPEIRALNLIWPTTMWIGDARPVHLSVESGESLDRDALQSYHLLAEARLEMDGLTAAPVETISQPLEEGQALTFEWRVHAQRSGNGRGAAWFYLRWIPLDEEGIEQRLAVAAQPFELRAVDFLGLNGSTARWLAGLGVVIGAVLILSSRGRRD